MSLPELLLVVFKKLWWVPLPFLGGKVLLEFARKYGRYRNMR